LPIFRADLHERRADEQRMEEDRRRENMENLGKDMEKTGGEAAILSTGLKDREADKYMMEEDEVMDDLDFDNFEEDGDEEVDKFSF